MEKLREQAYREGMKPLRISGAHEGRRRHHHASMKS